MDAEEELYLNSRLVFNTLHPEMLARAAIHITAHLRRQASPAKGVRCRLQMVWSKKLVGLLMMLVTKQNELRQASTRASSPVVSKHSLNSTSNWIE